MVKERVVDVASQTEQAIWLAAAGLFVGWLLSVPVSGQQLGLGEQPLIERAGDADRSRLHEPIYRISKTTNSAVTAQQLAATATRDAITGEIGLPGPKTERTDHHPLDPGLALARESLVNIEQNIMDYTCTLVKRERVHGELLEHEFIACKVRHPRNDEGEVVPFGVYLGFRKPDSMRGREVIYVEGRHDGKIIAHEGGIKGRFLPTVHLLPTSALALRGNRYPITEIGIMTLTRRLIEKGERDRSLGECRVRLIEGAKVKDRVCTMLEVVHDERRPQHDFHLARVFLDSELKIPIRYEAYGWPEVADGRPQLLEEYTYMDLKVNVGLNDADFDPQNPDYRF